MIITVSPTEDDIYASVGQFLTDICAFPAGSVIRGQSNRIAEPKSSDFAVMTLTMTPRLATNHDEYVDAVFTGDIAANVLNITAVDSDFAGLLAVGRVIFGVGVAVGTYIVALGTGTGGVGTYRLNNNQTLSSRLIAAGTASLEQSAEVVLQVDIHGPSGTDNVTKLTTIFFDQMGVDYFSGYGKGLSPLYIDPPKQVPFLNGEQQFEDRWILDFHMQANFKVVLPQDFYTSVEVGVINVDAVFPP